MVNMRNVVLCVVFYHNLTVMCLLFSFSKITYSSNFSSRASYVPRSLPPTTFFLVSALITLTLCTPEKLLILLQLFYDIDDFPRRTSSSTTAGLVPCAHHLRSVSTNGTMLSIHNLWWTESVYGAHPLRSSETVNLPPTLMLCCCFVAYGSYV